MGEPPAGAVAVCGHLRTEDECDGASHDLGSADACVVCVGLRSGVAP